MTHSEKSVSNFGTVQFLWVSAIFVDKYLVKWETIHGMKFREIPIFKRINIYFEHS